MPQFQTLPHPTVAGRLALRFIFVSVGVYAAAGTAALVLTRLVPFHPVPGQVVFPPAFWWTTGLLALGSGWLQHAVYCVRREKQKPFRRSLLFALGAGTLFVGAQSYGLGCLMRNQVPDEAQTGANAFITVLAALHAMHFALALLFLVWVTLNALADRYDHEYSWGVSLCAWFWHGLGIVWVLILVIFSIATELRADMGFDAPDTSPYRLASADLLSKRDHKVLVAGSPIAVRQAPQEKTKAAPTAKSVRKPGDIELEKSRVYVHVGKKGFGHEHAVEGRIKSGSLVLGAPRTKDATIGQIEFDMASFAADTDAARKYLEMKGMIPESTREQVTETMRGSDVLDVAKFPKAVFKIKSAVMSDGQAVERVYHLKGDFTLHGTTRPLEILAESELEQGKVRRLRSEFKVLQSDFGITPYKALGGAVRVADELKIHGDLWINVDEPAGK